MTKITIDRSVVEQALDALDVYACKAEHKRTHTDNCQAEEAITALRQALEQPVQQEPAGDKALTLATWLQANYEADEIDEAAGELRRLYGENRMLWKEREEPHRQLEFYVRECNRLESERDSALLVQSAQQEPVAHFGSAYVNENGVHVTTVLGPVAIPQDAKLYTTPPPAVIDTSAAIRIATALGWEPKREPLTEDWIRARCDKTWVFETVKSWVRATEAAHGIGEKK